MVYCKNCKTEFKLSTFCWACSVNDEYEEWGVGVYPETFDNESTNTLPLNLMKKFDETDETDHPKETEDNRPVCKFWLRGNCRFGDDCYNSHKDNREICLFALRGKCRFGADQCRKKHPVPLS